MPHGHTGVDLTPFWLAWDQIRSEHQPARMEGYVAAHEFWASYYHRLRLSSGHIAQNLADMEENSGWSDAGNPSAASSAFYGRIREGLSSIGAWMMSGLGTAQQRFGTLVQDIGMHYRAVEELLRGPNGLLAQDKVVGERVVPDKELLTEPVLAKITELDRGERAVVVVPASTAAHINTLILEAQTRHEQLRDRFREVSAALDGLNPEPWRGPATFAGLAPPGGPAALAAPGGPPGGVGGPGTTAAPDAAGPGGPGAPPGAGQEAAATPSTPEPGADLPGPDQPGLEEPAVDPTAADSSATDPTPADPTAADSTTLDPAMAELPRTDPELAGTPTVPSTSSLPAGNASPLPPAVQSGLSTATGGGPGAPIPLTPVGSTPLPSQFSSPPRRDAELPPTRSSTVDGARTAVPGAQGESPVPPGGTAGSGSGSGSGSRNGFGPGFYPPPMIPPMGMGGGAGGDGVRPGEADFASGPVRQVRGPEAWRAGLRPQLLGRAGDRDDEPDDCSPPVPAPGGEVLDEELWQVPGAAPPTPPEPQSRRGRSWGP